MYIVSVLIFAEKYFELKRFFLSLLFYVLSVSKCMVPICDDAFNHRFSLLLSIIKLFRDKGICINSCFINV